MPRKRTLLGFAALAFVTVDPAHAFPPGWISLAEGSPYACKRGEVYASGAEIYQYYLGPDATTCARMCSYYRWCVAFSYDYTVNRDGRRQNHCMLLGTNEIATRPFTGFSAFDYGVVCIREENAPHEPDTSFLADAARNYHQGRPSSASDSPLTKLLRR